LGYGGNTMKLSRIIAASAAFLLFGVQAAFAFEWYGPGSGIDYTGFVYGNNGLGFSWPWTFISGPSVNYSGFGGWSGGYGYGYGAGYGHAQAPQWQQVSPQSVLAGSMLRFTVTATNNYGGAITYSAMGLPSGAAFDSSTRTFSWMPNANQAGYYVVNFRATDRVGTADMAVTITVNAPQALPSYSYNPYTYGGASYYGGSGYTYGSGYAGSNYYQYNQQPQISPLNSVPVIYPIQQQTVRVGETLRIPIQAYDREGDYLQYSMTGEPQGAVLDQQTHTFIWTPTPLQIGQYRVNFRVSQGGQMYADTGVAIYVLDRTGNLPVTACTAGPGPYLYAFAPSSTVREGDLFSYQIIASSGNGNQVSYRIVDGPIGLTIDSKTGYMRWVPSFNQSGNYQVRIGIYNGQCEGVQTFNLTVQDVR
jgi:hypothetical protein